MTIALPIDRTLRLLPMAQLTASGSWQMDLVHDRAESLLIWLTRGQGTAFLDGARRGIGAHNLLFIPARNTMAIELGRQAFGHALIIPPDSPVELPGRPLHIRSRDTASQTELTGLIDALGREQTAGRPYSENAAAAYGDLIFIWLQRHLTESDSPRDTAARRLIRKYCARLVLDHASPASMADYAAALSVTPTHLTRVCRAETGKTAAALLTERKLHAARRFLTETDVAIQDVARHLGFGSAPYFTRFIQQHTGHPPTELRKSTRRRV